MTGQRLMTGQHLVTKQDLMRGSTDVDKRQVARQFERAAKRYDDVATMQDGIQQHLMALLNAMPGFNPPERILDLGCGTGSGLAQLAQQYPNARLSGVDIAPAMLQIAQQRCPTATLIDADIEALPLPENTFDLVYSASSLQWCDHANAIAESARVLSPGGTLAVATFGPATLQEWRTAWAAVDETTHTLNYPDLPTILKALNTAGIEVENSEQEMQIQRFSTPKEMLMSVKQLGATNANRQRQAGLMGKRKFDQFVHQLTTSPKRLALSYEVFYITGKKR